MSSLFKNIYYLLRKGQSDIFEDYLTEIFAEIFEDRDMLIKFFAKFAPASKLNDPLYIQVSTQKTLLKLPGHETNSRPDLVIQFRDNGRQFIVFFENKLEADEGNLQLQRYAEHLKVYNKMGFNTFFFYITRYYDPKEEDGLIQLRWYKVYNWLKENRSTFNDKIITFMEEIHLNETRRFLPQDIFAIQQMKRLQNMMDESLDGSVDEVMTSLFGKAIGWSNRMVQLRDHSRYLKANIQDTNWSTWIGCGFKLTEGDYPLVSVMFEISPALQKRNEALEAINGFLNSTGKQNGWKGYNLEDNTKWSGVSCDKELLDFLKHEDHINAVQEFFIEKLNELSLFQKQNSLNWKI